MSEKKNPKKGEWKLKKDVDEYPWFSYVKLKPHSTRSWSSSRPLHVTAID